jgi:hypothetical protein
MKRLSVFIFLPLILSALERVNLIRNGSFERDDSIWIVESGASMNPNPAIGTTKDSSESISGKFSASADTKERPTWSGGGLYDTVVVRQYFLASKKLSDLDSLSWHHLIIPCSPSSVTSADMCIVGFTFANPERNGFSYTFINPELNAGYGIYILEKISEDDLVWRPFEKSLQQDFVESNLVPSNRELASFVLIGWGIWWDFHSWWGQKVYWDDIRLMGYADYDVGVKYLLSPDSIGTSEALGESLRNSPLADYTPVAGIKNFGREDAPEFSVIAEIWEGETRLYYDSLPWSLTSDTEDTVTFADFTPTNAANHTLTVRTVMEPDESDEDDEMSKTLYGTGISEPVTHLAPITLDVRSLTHPLRVSYALPYGEQGTLTLYDATGRRIERVNVKASGSIEEFTSALPSGIYIVRLESGHGSISRKAVVLK